MAHLQAKFLEAGAQILESDRAEFQPLLEYESGSMTPTYSINP